MKKQKVKDYQFAGATLKILIDKKAKDSNVPKAKIRTVMCMSMGITKQSLSAWETANKNKITKGKKYVTAPGISYLFWIKDFFGLPKIDNLFSEI